MTTNNAVDVPLPDKVTEKIFKFEYNWTINSVQNGNKLVQSPKFYIGHYNEIEGYLQVHLLFGGNGGATSGRLFLYLKHCLCEDPAKQLLHIKIDKLKVHIVCGGGTNELISNSEQVSSYIETSGGHSRYISVCEIALTSAVVNSLSIIHCSKLQIKCRCDTKVQTTRNGSMKIPIKNAKLPVLNNMESYLENGKLSDVKIDVSGHEYNAHKVILAAQNPVFSAMFDHEMTEQCENRVDIPDIDHEVFREMLHFMYTGESPNIKQMTESLLSAANKYQVERLKVMCEETLGGNLTIENAAETLILADIHNADHLKSHIIKFIVENSFDVTKTTSFKSLMPLHGQLLHEVLTALAEYANNNSSLLITILENERESATLRHIQE